MKTRITGIVTAFCLAAVVPALAADLGLGLRAGTYGLGAELGVGINSWFGLRAGLYTLDIDESYTDSGIDFDGKLKLGGYGVLADFYPMKGTFRLTAGLLANRNEIDLSAVPFEPVEIGGTTYQPSDVGTLSGGVEFDDTAPYFGIGWGNVARGKGRVGFLCDLGFVKQGSGDVVLRASNPAVSQSDLDAETAEIEDDIEDYDFWPVISFGLSIRF